MAGLCWPRVGAFSANQASRGGDHQLLGSRPERGNHAGFAQPEVDVHRERAAEGLLRASSRQDHGFSFGSWGRFTFALARRDLEFFFPRSEKRSVSTSTPVSDRPTPGSAECCMPGACPCLGAMKWPRPCKPRTHSINGKIHNADALPARYQAKGLQATRVTVVSDGTYKMLPLYPCRHGPARRPRSAAAEPLGGLGI